MAATLSSAPRRDARRPYRPKEVFAAPPETAPGHMPYGEHGLEYQPRRVMVANLTPTISSNDLASYFGNFGHVVAVVLKMRPTKVYAFVEFGDQAGVETTLGMAPHMVKTQDVRVVRAYAIDLPSCPFPGMDPLSSPVGQAIAQETLFGRTKADVAFLPRELPQALPRALALA